MALLEDHDPDTLCQSIYAPLHERAGVDVYFHFLTAPDGAHLELVSSAGSQAVRAMLGTRLNLGQAVCGFVAQHREPMRLENIESRNDEMTSMVREAGVRAYACFPLIRRNEVLGTISFGSTVYSNFTDEQFELFALIAHGMALATERRRQTEYLRTIEQFAAAGRMSAILAHEVNNPLESLASVLYLLQDEVPSPHGRELLEMANSQVTRLAETARRILETFRGTGATPKITDISALTRELVADISLPRDAHLVTEITDGLCCKVIAGEVRQVLFNLLLNAAQFSPLGGRVRLSVQPCDGYAEIRISDEGDGISEANRGKVFQPFYTTRAKGGTGIGLWLSHELVERNGGTLRFESTATPGHGTTFVARLPLVD